MINRRNYYRLLQVQPDATLAVIRASYRTLMQKLRLHPDLGGDDWNAALLNAAYAALRDCTKRAAYDRELLAQYDIETLSQGGRQTPTRGSRPAAGGANRRNYYRVLQVQPDAPAATIDASFRALRHEAKTPQALLQEAYATLRDPQRRREYDDALASQGHRKPAHDSPGERSAPQSLAADEIQAGAVKASAAARAEPNPWTAAAGYEPLITGYCAFCKTPHPVWVGPAEDASCVECGSPLAPPTQERLEPARRGLARVERNDMLGYYVYWPGRRHTGTLQDLSPSGLRFASVQALASGQILKIDADRFQATGEVAYARREGAALAVGVRFLAVRFASQRGNFIAATV